MVDAQPNKLEQQIDEAMTQLRSKNAGKRRDAAYFLGEAAAEDAVGPLVDLYENDKDKSVRAAAAYALGMYKAVERALKAGDEAEVVTLLTRIEEKGKLGSRAKVGRNIKIQLALLVSLLVMLGLFLVRNEIRALVFPSTRTQAQVVAEARAAFNLVRNDTRTLQTELLDVISGRPLGCIAYFNNPAPHTLDPADARTFQNVAVIVDQINAAQASLAAAKARYDAACNDGAPFGAAEAQETFQLLLPALQSLDTIELSLTGLESAQTAAQTAAQPMPTLAVLEQPTAVPVEPTQSLLQGDVEMQTAVPGDVVAGANPKSHLPALFNLIDDVTSPRGAGGLLVQYWTDVQNSGSTTGCSVPAPAVPVNNVSIPDADFAASPDLRDAVTQINNGLNLLATGWTDFQNACFSNALADRMSTELGEARLAMISFDAAEVKLEAVRNAP